MIDKLKSRKLWMTLLGAGIVGVFNPGALIAYLKVAIPTYLAAQGATDAAAAFKGKS